MTTQTGNITILERFCIPQLNRKRSIWIYLPPDYETSEKHYPVWYMQDGQNLFDNQTARSGEWEVDETLERLFEQGKSEGVIIVGIENDAVHRRSEYSPWDLQVLGQDMPGEGDAYVDFLRHTLKPFIDSKFRTRPERQHTTIAGSSMGGLISLYSGFRHPDTFGNVVAISLCVLRSRMGDTPFEYFENVEAQEPMKIYLDIGDAEQVDLETVALVDEATEIAAYLRQKPLVDLEFQVIEGAKHHEDDWRDRFESILLHMTK